MGLIRSYADGRTDDEAFSAALGVDMTAFAAAWLDDVDAKAPTRYGPQPAPAGPVPAAWAGSPGGGLISPPPTAASAAPTPTEATSPVPGVIGGSGVAEVPAWAAPVVALIAVVVVAILLVGARRNRASAGTS